MMRVKNRKTFTRRLVAAGISQNELARRLALSKGYMSDVANGNKRIDEADAGLIADQLGVPVATLFVTVPRPSRIKAEVSS